MNSKIVLQRYKLPAIALHWLMALLILSMFPLGWYMTSLPETIVRAKPFALHKSLGLLVFVLLWLRLFWRIKNPPPPLPAVIPAWQKNLAERVHTGFYILLFLLPISGYLSSSFTGRKTTFFGLPLPHWGWKDEALNELFTGVHELVGVILLLLIILHVSGAVSHMFKRDGLIYRMLPSRR